MNKVTRDNLQDFCRTCLRSISSTLATTSASPSTLFGYNLNELPQLLELVLMLTSFGDVVEHAAFPRSLCQLCYFKLINIQDFQRIAVDSAMKLRKLLTQTAGNSLDYNNKLYAVPLHRGKEDSEDDNKLLLPELVNLLDKPVKTEQIDIGDTEIQDNNSFQHISQNEMRKDVQIKKECFTEERFYLNDTVSHESLDDEADDADDEEYLLRNGAANSSSTSTTSSLQIRNKKSLKCPRCEKHAYKKVYLDAHIRAVHEGYKKPFLCDTCEKAFTRYNQLREHIQSIHVLKEKIICTFNGCNTSFQSRNSLQTHFKVKHAIESIGLQEMLKLHTNIELSDEGMQNMCFQCARPYSSKRALSEHLKRHAQIKEHICKVCGVAKVTRTELRTHMRTHEPNVEKFSCSMCPQQFNHKNAISRHVRVVHEGHRAYSCSYCPKRFGTRNSQLCHERLHTGERPFSCKFCVKTFTQMEGLKSHMKNHDKNLRKYVCSYCNQRFITRQNLIDHEKRHEGSKPHICVICSRGFYSAEELNKHRESHSEKKDYQSELLQNPDFRM